MPRLRHAFSCLFLLLSASESAFAATASGAGTTGATFLEIGIGARSAAMGEANTSWADDVYGMYFNPAGIATVRRQEVGFAHNTLFLDLDYNYLGYVHPLGDASSIGVSGTYVDLGDVERREIIAGGGPSGALGNASAYDLSFSLTYARTLSEVIDLGGTLKVIHETLDNYSASAVAVDLGAKWRPPVEGLTVGLSVLNLGSNLKFVASGDELPISIRFGAGYRPPSRRWGLQGDLVYVKNQDVEGKIGGEWWVWEDHIAIRAGANSANDAGSGFTVGAGFKWNDILLDYAYVPFGDLGDQNLISLAYQFGAPRGVPPERTMTRYEPSPTQPASVSAPPPSTPYATGEAAGSTVTMYTTAPAAQPWGVSVTPFAYRSGPPEYDWMSRATADVLAKDWKKRGLLNTAMSSARFQVEGEFWIVGRNLILSARLSGDGFRYAADANGDADKPFEVWTALLQKLNDALRERGVLSAPAPVPAPAPQSSEWSPAPSWASRPPAPAAPSQPAYTASTPLPPSPASTAPRKGVAVATIMEHGNAVSSARSSMLTTAVRDALVGLGFSTDASTAQYRFDATYADLDDGSTVVYGKIVDRATGIPIANVEVYGSASNPASFASRIADAVMFKLPK
ncbi:MAG: PorV/PorQ family protein [Candidatus Hydrogenedentota bacterium]